MPRSGPCITLCDGSTCRRKGGRKLKKKARKVLAKLGFSRDGVATRSCRGRCGKAPLYCIDRGDWVPFARPRHLKRDLAARARGPA